MKTMTSSKQDYLDASNRPSQIRTIQDMWDATIKYYTQGDFDTDAMYAIYRRMDPRLTYQDIANVFSGVYADSYWNDIFMDYSFLSKSMQQALALSPASANLYAKNAIAQWRGILSRKNISDIGSIPTPGNITQSIDIVCNQNTPIFPEALIQNWNSSYWETPQVGKNYIYVRCANVQFLGDIAKTQAQMFYTTGGFNQPPTSWIQCLTVDNGSTSGEILLLDGKPGPMPIGTRGASEAFSLEPTSTNHICVIAAINTEFFTKNQPTTIPPGNWNSATYITHNGSSAWHNLNPQVSLVDTLNFYNQDETPETFTFVATCQNVPVGSKISLSSDDTEASFTTGAIAVSRSSQVIKKTVTVPGNYKGNLKVSLQDAKGNLLPESSSVEIKMLWVLKPGHQYYADASESAMNIDMYKENSAIDVSLGTYTILGGAKG